MLSRIGSYLLCLSALQTALFSQGGTNIVEFQPGKPFVSGYDLYQGDIDTALQQMFNNGQRRLRIPIFHIRSGETCTGMYSRSANIASSSLGLASNCATNLLNLLNKIKYLGFGEVIVSMHPQSYAPLGLYNDPISWPSNWQGNPTYESFYQEDWAVIQHVRSIVTSVGIPYKLDLLNEGLPSLTINQYGLRDYVRRGMVGYKRRRAERVIGTASLN